MRAEKTGLIVLALACGVALAAFPVPTLLFALWPLSLVGFVGVALARPLAGGVGGACFVGLTALGFAGLGVTVRGGDEVAAGAGVGQAVGSMLLVLSLPAALGAFVAVSGQGFRRAAGLASLAAVAGAPFALRAGIGDAVLVALLALGALTGYVAFALEAVASARRRGAPT